MAKSMADRIVYVGVQYLDIQKNYPELKNGFFKPDLTPLCKKYDKNIDDYNAQLKRTEFMSGYLEEVADLLDKRNAAVQQLNAESDKIFQQGNDLAKQYCAKINDAIAKGERADPTATSAALKEYASSVKGLLELQKAHAERKDTLNAKHIEAVNKASNNYEKAAKEIKTAIDKLESDSDRLEAQICKTVLSYQKTAVKMNKPELESALEEVLAAFK